MLVLNIKKNKKRKHFVMLDENVKIQLEEYLSSSGTFITEVISI